MTDFLAQFIGNPTRAKVLRVFVFEESRALTAADAGKRAGLSVKVVEEEIAALEKMNILAREHVSILLKNDPGRSVKAKNQKVSAWMLNPAFKHVRALSTFIREISPVEHDRIVSALKRGGKIATVVLSGCFLGDPSRPADLLVAADALNEKQFDEAVRDLEPSIGREIRYAAFSTPEFRYRLTVQDRLIRDTLDYPHLVILDRAHLL